MYKLINAGPSPYGRKVAVALHEKGLAFEMAYDLPWSTAIETRKHSPLEQLPILLVPDSEPVFDSCYILDWLEWTHPAIPLLPAKLADRLAARRLQVLGERLMEIAQSIIFENHRPMPAEATLERQSRKIISGLQAAEEMLAESHGDSDRPPHLGEIAIATTLLCWEFVIAEGVSPALDIFTWRSRYPCITARVNSLDERPSFVSTRPKPMQIDIAGETH